MRVHGSSGVVVMVVVVIVVMMGFWGLYDWKLISSEAYTAAGISR